MSYVFFSYSRKDRERAKEIVDGLRARGVVVWQDISDIRGGANWLTSIQKGLDGAALVLVLWSASASASNWVREEVQLAKVKNKVVVPYRLDDTPLSDDLTMTNALRTDERIETLMAHLPKDIIRRKLPFDAARNLGAQASKIWEPETGLSLASVPLLQSSFCAAHVVGAPETAVRQPGTLWVCVQFTREANQNAISEVYRVYLSERDDDTPPFVALHITGPVNYDDKYMLDNDNPAQWQDAMDTTVSAIQRLSETRYPLLNVMSVAPAALMMGIGSKLWRFWTAHLYNYVPNGKPPYRRVLTLQQ